MPIKIPENSCFSTYQVVPLDSQLHTPNEEIDHVTVEATPSNCKWQTRTETAWVNITAGSSAQGKGAVEYTIKANPSEEQRQGIITVMGEHFSHDFGVNQDGVNNKAPIAKFTIYRYYEFYCR